MLKVKKTFYSERNTVVKSIGWEVYKSDEDGNDITENRNEINTQHRVE